MGNFQNGQNLLKNALYLGWQQIYCYAAFAIKHFLKIEPMTCRAIFPVKTEQIWTPCTSDKYVIYARQMIQLKTDESDAAGLPFYFCKWLPCIKKARNVNLKSTEHG